MDKINKLDAASGMRLACLDFLESLDEEDLSKVRFDYADGERLFWYYPPLNRHGLSLALMSGEQKILAIKIVQSALSEKSYAQACAIIDNETLLGEIEKSSNNISWKRDPGRYFFTIFGNPKGNKPWGWRVEGHHLSLHFSIWENKVISVTPFFFGSNPAEIKHGSKRGSRILARREDLAFQIMNSLSKSQQAKAIIYDKAPYDILTSNSSKAIIPAEEGISGGKLDVEQQEILRELVKTYVNQVDITVSQNKLESILSRGFNHIFLAWAGPVSREEGHYYRIHGGNFLVEFDNCQNDANHIHSVWRDLENDFAEDVLKKHLFLYHEI